MSGRACFVDAQPSSSAVHPFFEQKHMGILRVENIPGTQITRRGQRFTKPR